MKPDNAGKLHAKAPWPQANTGSNLFSELVLPGETSAGFGRTIWTELLA